jgi:hypothetical protein
MPNLSPLGQFGTVALGRQIAAGVPVLPTVLAEKTSAGGFRPNAARVRPKGSRGKFSPEAAEVAGLEAAFNVDFEATEPLLKMVLEHMLGSPPVANIITPSEILDWGNSLALPPLTIDISQPFHQWRITDAQIKKLMLKWNANGYVTGSIEGLGISSSRLYAGTASAAAGGVAVVGVGTNFLLEVRAGDKIIFGDGTERIVAGVTSATALTVTGANFAAIVVAAAYQVVPQIAQGARFIDQNVSITVGGSAFVPEEASISLEVLLEFVDGVTGTQNPAAILRPGSDDGHIKLETDYTLRGTNATLEALQRQGGTIASIFSMVRGGSIIRFNSPTLDVEGFDPNFDNGPARAGIKGLAVGGFTVAYA